MEEKRVERFRNFERRGIQGVLAVAELQQWRGGQLPPTTFIIYHHCYQNNQILSSSVGVASSEKLSLPPPYHSSTPTTCKHFCRVVGNVHQDESSVHLRDQEAILLIKQLQENNKDILDLRDPHYHRTHGSNTLHETEQDSQPHNNEIFGSKDFDPDTMRPSKKRQCPLGEDIRGSEPFISDACIVCEVSKL
ncbi:hypothetical protein YC2023_090417 [Brassica napus]